MTLTEEQRGTVAFDLERARGLRDFLQDDCAEVGDVWGEMIAEIERLRGFETAARDLSNDLTRVAKERDELQEANTNFAFQASDQAQEIERLRTRESGLEQRLEWTIRDGFKKQEEQVAKIKELEGQVYHLVKELQVSENHLASCDLRQRSEEAILNRRIKELKADLEQSEICIQARLDVIDQQAARIKSLKKEIRRLKHESKVEQEFTNSYIKRLHDAEARIKELGSSLDEAEALTKKNAELMNGYLRRIAELEDALVEGLTNFLHYRASCYDPARRCPYAKECDDCSTWDACGHVEMFRSEARRQLQAEGKIGPDAKPRVWQITE